MFQMLLWYSAAGIPNVHAIRVGCGVGVPPPFRRGRQGGGIHSALPEKRIAANFNGTGFWGELTCVIENVDENLFNLAGFEVQGKIARVEIDADCDGFLVRKGGDLV